MFAQMLTQRKLNKNFNDLRQARPVLGRSPENVHELMDAFAKKELLPLRAQVEKRITKYLSR